MTRHPLAARVSTPTDSTVEVVRAFRAPRPLVWEAYTTPELMKRWLLGPPGWTFPVCEMDVRVGGAFRWRWRSEESGGEFGFHGAFIEVDPPDRLVHTEIYDPGDAGGSMGEGGSATVTLTFEEDDGVTVLRTLIAYDSKEARDGALASGMTDGMEMSYKLLDEVLGEGS